MGVALIDSYKTHRLAPRAARPCRTSLTPQIPVILEMLDAFGIAAVGAEGYEADDVIGTLAAREPGPVEVASGDRDLFQVVDDHATCAVLYIGKGVAKLEVLDEPRSRPVRRRRRYADFAALRGDPSDGLPGVPGVGEKSAARLVPVRFDWTRWSPRWTTPVSGVRPPAPGQADRGARLPGRGAGRGGSRADAPLPD